MLAKYTPNKLNHPRKANATGVGCGAWIDALAGELERRAHGLKKLSHMMCMKDEADAMRERETLLAVAKWLRAETESASIVKDKPRPEGRGSIHE